MPYKIDEVLEFLKENKSRRELMDHFDLSNSESWHLCRWLEKADLVSVTNRVYVKGVPNRIKLYRAKPDA